MGGPGGGTWGIPGGGWFKGGATPPPSVCCGTPPGGGGIWVEGCLDDMGGGMDCCEGEQGSALIGNDASYCQ